MAERTTHLTRSLGLGSVTLFGLAYMAPMIVLGIFGVIAETAGGSSASAYLVATVAINGVKVLVNGWRLARGR